MTTPIQKFLLKSQGDPAERGGTPQTSDVNNPAAFDRAMKVGRALNSGWGWGARMAPGFGLTLSVLQKVADAKIGRAMGRKTSFWDGWADTPSIDVADEYGIHGGNFQSVRDYYGPGQTTERHGGEAEAMEAVARERRERDRFEADDTFGGGAGRDDVGNSQGGVEGMSEEDASGVGWYQGGPVTAARLQGPNPAGPDDGYGGLDVGEYVVRANAVNDLKRRHGSNVMSLLNRGVMPRRA